MKHMKDCEHTPFLILATPMRTNTIQSVTCTLCLAQCNMHVEDILFLLFIDIFKMINIAALQKRTFKIRLVLF